MLYGQPSHSGASTYCHVVCSDVKPLSGAYRQHAQHAGGVAGIRTADTHLECPGGAFRICARLSVLSSSALTFIDLTNPSTSDGAHQRTSLPCREKHQRKAQTKAATSGEI